MNKRPVLPKNVASAGPASEGVGLLRQAGGHGQPGQGGAFGPAAAVVGGAGLEGGKLAAGGGLVPVDLPAAHALASLAPVADEARHVLRGIAQEEADLMGKIPAGPQAAAEFRQAGPLAQVPVARLAEQAADLLLGQVPGQGGRAEEVQQGPPLLPAQGDQPQPPGHQHPVHGPQLLRQSLGGGEEAGEEVPRFHPRQGGGAVANHSILRHGSSSGSGVLGQDAAQGGHGAGPGTDDHRVLPPGFVQRVLDHFVGDGVGKHHQQVGAAQPVFQGASHLGDHLGGALIGPAEVLVLADHTLVSAENDNTHKVSFLWLVFANYRGDRTRPLGGTRKERKNGTDFLQQRGGFPGG